MEDVKKGTTTVAIVCKDAVVLATDRRASMGYLVAHKNVKKVYQIDDYIGATVAGSVGDIQSLIGSLKAEVNLYKMKNGTKMSTRSLATLTSHILHGQRYYPLIAWLIVAGFDDKPTAYSIDPIGGVNEDKAISTGSGSLVAYGVLESLYKDDMGWEEGAFVAIKAIKAAIERDLATGNGITMAVIDKDGYRELSDEEIIGLSNHN